MWLRFKSEEERLRHSHASLISAVAWYELFNKMLNTKELNILKAPKGQISLTPQTSERELYCMLIVNHEMADKQLLTLIKDAKLAFDTAIKSLIWAKRNDLALKLVCTLSLDWHEATLPSYEELGPLLPVNNNALLRAAINAAPDNQAFIESLFSLCQHDVKEKLISYNSYYFVSMIIHFDKLDLFNFIYHHCPNSIKNLLSQPIRDPYREAIANNNDTLLLRLFEIAGKDDFKENDDGSENIWDKSVIYDSLKLAAEKGNLALFKRLYDLFGRVCLFELNKRDGYNLLNRAARYGQIGFMQLLMATFPFDKEKMIESGDYVVFMVAASWDRLDVINLLVSLMPDKCQDMLEAPFSFGFAHYKAMKLAIENGYILMVKHLIELSKKPEDMVSYHIEFAFRLLEKEPQSIRIELVKLLLITILTTNPTAFLSLMNDWVKYLQEKNREDILTIISSFSFYNTINGGICVPEYLCDLTRKHLEPNNLPDFLIPETHSLAIPINEIRLVELIHVLENSQKPIAYLACGLLLEGRFETEMPTNYLTETNSKSFTEYMEKRTHDAITFYVRATKDSELRPIVTHLLWNLSMLGSWSVRYRLSEFSELQPCEHVMPSWSKYHNQRTSLIPRFFKSLPIIVNGTNNDGCVIDQLVQQGIFA